MYISKYSNLRMTQKCLARLTVMKIKTLYTKVYGVNSLYSHMLINYDKENPYI